MIETLKPMLQKLADFLLFSSIPFVSLSLLQEKLAFKYMQIDFDEELAELKKTVEKGRDTVQLSEQNDKFIQNYF